MNEKAEARLRRKAMRMLSVGRKPGEVLKQVGRGRGWLSKWRRRYHHQGLAGLRGQSRQPHRLPQAWSKGMSRMIAQTRRRLSKAKAGLIGGHAIVNELRKLLPRQRLPSEKTVYRKLHQTGLIASPKPTTPPYYPWPTDELPTQASLDALDWTCRFLEGDAKVYAFHTLNLRTLELHQTLANNKTLETAQRHVLEAWKTRGIPHFLQLDNDAIFCGGYNVVRVIGQFVRLCLLVGIELIFTPFKEPQHNFQVEQLNGLWGGPAFWRRHHFRCLGDVRRLSPAFTDWYMHTYTPPSLHGDTPAERHATEHRPHLNHAMTRLIPPTLPITSGRIHFIRHVQVDGTIRILNEIWPIGKRLAGQYVWATITTHRHTLDIWHRRGANRPWRLIKHIHYYLGEQVHRPLQPFIDLFTMS